MDWNFLLNVCAAVGCFFIRQPEKKGSKQAPRVSPLLNRQHMLYANVNVCFTCSLIQPTDQSGSVVVILYAFKRYHLKAIQKALNTLRQRTSVIPSLPVNSKQLGQDKVNSLADPVSSHLS